MERYECPNCHTKLTEAKALFVEHCPLYVAQCICGYTTPLVTLIELQQLLNPKLNNCPLCGSDDVSEILNRSHGWSKDGITHNHHVEVTTGGVICHTCGCAAPSREAWNTRPLVKPPLGDPNATKLLLDIGETINVTYGDWNIYRSVIKELVERYRCRK
jgi:hypothetical protein